MDLNLSIYSSNISSIVSIFEDTKVIREKKANELLKKLEEQSEWTEEEFQEYSHYQYHFDWLLMHSLFLSGFSYFENYMRATAKEIENKVGGKIKIKDIKGNGYLDTFRKYIHLIGEISSANDNSENWKSILSFKDVRNSITHQSGQIKKESTKIVEHDIFFGPSKKLIRIRNIDFIKDFVRVSIDLMTAIANEKNKKYGS
ncbi:hypothetical protein [Saccharicrinis sp. GN24d3]|uniref:hypothetical protein n=1 Tax=Saccharicrinis sp. GN24d3 TaxID=3458416 RepID=UPI00403535A8